MHGWKEFITEQQHQQRMHTLMQVTTAIEWIHKMAAAAREAASLKQEEVKDIKEADKKGGKNGKVKKEGGKKDGEKKERWFLYCHDVQGPAPPGGLRPFF